MGNSETFGVQKGQKFDTFRADLPEFRVEKQYFSVCNTMLHLGILRLIMQHADQIYIRYIRLGYNGSSLDHRTHMISKIRKLVKYNE